MFWCGDSSYHWHDSLLEDHWRKIETLWVVSLNWRGDLREWEMQYLCENGNDHGRKETLHNQNHHGYTAWTWGFFKLLFHGEKVSGSTVRMTEKEKSQPVESLGWTFQEAWACASIPLSSQLRVLLIVWRLFFMLLIKEYIVGSSTFRDSAFYNGIKYSWRHHRIIFYSALKTSSPILKAATSA